MKNLLLYEIASGKYSILTTPWHNDDVCAIKTTEGRTKWKIIAEVVQADDAINIATLLNDLF